VTSKVSHNREYVQIYFLFFILAMTSPVIGRSFSLYRRVANSHNLLVGSSASNFRRFLHHDNQKSATIAATATHNATSEVDTCYNKLDLSFENGKEAFKVCLILLRLNKLL
jgi:hypothetical protein